VPISSLSRGTVLALTLAAACWGLGTVVSKRAVAEIPPLTLLPIQLGASLVLLAVLMRARGLPFRDRTASPILGRLGILNPGASYALSLLGLVSITASLSVMLWALEPLLILALAAWVLGERITPALVVLSLVAVGGMLLVAFEPDSTGSPIGIALTVAGVACCAIYTVIARRWLPSSDSTAQVVVGQQAHALVFAFGAAAAVWFLGGAVAPAAVSPIGWASAVGSGVLYYGLAYWLYLTGLRRAPASTAAASFYLIPIFGVAGGSLLLGERFEPGQWLGVAIVLVSIALIYARSLATAGPIAAASGHAAPRSGASSAGGASFRGGSVEQGRDGGETT
jgi:probable blue pigment (indigoidine) exporter